MDADRDEAQRRIEALTIAISVRSLPLVMGSLTDTSLTLQQLRVLTAVVIGGEASTMVTLASSFKVSKATMSKLLDRLVSAGLIARLPDGADQRVKRLSPTPLGRDVVARVLGARPELGADVLAGLDAEELHHLELGLRAINRELQRAALS